MSTSGLIVEQDFGPEMAGERVGWVRFGEIDIHANPHVAVQLALGYVASTGAHVAYESVDNSPLFRTVEIVEGITFGQCMTFYCPQDDSDRAVATFTRPEWDQTRWPKDLATFMRIGNRSLYPHFGNSKKTWGSCPADIIGVIKKGMAERDLLQWYPGLYYAYNVLAQEEHDNLELTEPALEKRLLVDPDMSETTHKHLKTFLGFRHLLKNILAGDLFLLHNLQTVFSSIPQDKVTEEYDRFRRTVVGAKAKIISLNDTLDYSGLCIAVPASPWELDAHIGRQGTGFTEEAVYRLLALRDVKPAVSALEREARIVRECLEISERKREMLQTLARLEK